MRTRTDEMYHMATVMYQAAKTEDNTLQHLEERLAQLEYENKYLREVLSLSSPVSTSEAFPQDSKEDKKEETNNQSVGATERLDDTTSANTTSDSDTDRDSRSSTPRND